MRMNRIAACAAILLISLAPIASAAEQVKPGQELSLDQAIEITLRNHPRGRAARSEAASAAETIGVARSQMMPQVFGSAQYLAATDNGIGDASFINPGFIPRIPGRDHDFPSSASPGQSFSPGNNFEMSIGAYQYLFDFGRARGMIDESRYQAARAQAEAKLTDLDLIFEATQRYFALLASHQKVKVYEKAVAQREAQLHAAQVKAGAGLVPEIDVYTGQAELARAKVLRLDAQNAEQIAKVSLDNSMALGRSAPEYKLADVLGYQPITGEVPTYYNAALQSRPDLQMLEEAARAEGARITEFRSDYFPNMHAVAGYNALGTGLPAANNFDAGVMISWPIFNGFETRHQIEQARLHRDAIRHSIEALRQHVYLEVKSAFLTWQASLDRIRRTELTVAASRARLELANKRYDAGLGNIIELTDAERFYIQDDAAYVDALYEYSVAKAVLGRATGELLIRG